jgi:ribonuclease D
MRANMAEVPEEIVSTAEELAACCAFLAGCPTIGFDTEFVGEATYHPRLCLVQVAAPTRLFLIDPLTAGPLDAFWQLVVDPGRVVVVHAGREEVRLCRLWSGQPPGCLFDLQLAAGLTGLTYPLGHGALVNQVVGVRLAKGETLTEWGRRPLTAEQLRYAFDDVRFLLRAHDKLSARLANLGRLDWAREEFARLARIAGPEDPAAEERWRKLKGIGGLDRRKLAVVRALYHWREERAAAVNRPARTVVRDDLLVEIARRNPTRARDLQVVRGLQSRELDAIVEVVQEARKLPPEQCPEAAERVDDPPQLNLAANILFAVLADACARQRLAANLVASNSDVRALVRARLAGEPLPQDFPLMSGWRAAHVLPGLLAVLDGRRAVRIVDLKADAPLGYAEMAETAQDRPAGNE